MSPFQIVLIAIAEVLVLFFVLLLGGLIRIRIRYKTRLVISLNVLGISIPLYKEPKRGAKKPKKVKSPKQILKEQEKKEQKKAKSALKKQKAKEKKLRKLEQQEQHPVPTLSPAEKVKLVLNLVKTSLDDVKGNIEVNFKKMHIYVGTGNAAATALLYSVILQGVTAICETVERKITHVERKPGAMTVEADYKADKCSADIDVSCSLRTIRGIGMGLHILSEFKRQKAKLMKTAKIRFKKKHQK